MMLINRDKKSAIAKDAVLCLGLFSKIKGLMFTRKPKSLIFDFCSEKRIGLHMWFVFYPIDVLFLDKNGKVVELKTGFMPFSAYTSKKKARYAIELPEGSIRKSRTAIGDRIGW